jgi:hypothetical protein
MVLQDDLDRVERELGEVILQLSDSHAAILSRIIGLIEDLYPRVQHLESEGRARSETERR